MRHRIYLASSWRNEDQPATVKALREAGHEVYDFHNPKENGRGFSWDEIDVNWMSWSPEQFIRHINNPIAQAGYQCDKQGLDWCDICVLLLPCGRSAHLEAGYIIGQGKPTFWFLKPGMFEPELMYLLGGGFAMDMNTLITLIGSVK